VFIDSSVGCDDSGRFDERFDRSIAVAGVSVVAGGILSLGRKCSRGPIHPVGHCAISHKPKAISRDFFVLYLALGS
jgi:hypothetical protein